MFKGGVGIKYTMSSLIYLSESNIYFKYTMQFSMTFKVDIYQSYMQRRPMGDLDKATTSSYCYFSPQIKICLKNTR